jgi:hypothetical protein
MVLLSIASCPMLLRVKLREGEAGSSPQYNNKAKGVRGLKRSCPDEPWKDDNYVGQEDNTSSWGRIGLQEID